MAFKHLTHSANFWRQAGLKYILSPEKILAEEKNYPPRQALAKEKTYASGAFEKNTIVWQQPESPDGISCAPKAPPAWKPLARDELPAAWQIHLNKARRGYAAWTYLALAQDMGETAQDDMEKQSRQLRKNFIRNLIRELGMPEGTHTFWPCTVRENNMLIPNSEAFWSGLRWLGCRMLFIFGKDAAKACGFENLPPPVYRACFICALDNLEKLAVAPNGKIRAAALMKSAFSIKG